MKTAQYTFKNPKTYFTVTKNDINDNNALLPNVLYETMEEFVNTIILNNPDIANIPPKLYQLKILKNAFLDDKLLLQSNIIKFNASELLLSIVVKQKEKKHPTIICKAVFKFHLKQNIQKAS
jgi:hypothetical protein